MLHSITNTLFSGKKSRLAIITTTLWMACFHLTHASDAPWGPKAFDVEEGWTAIVAAYAPEIKAIEAMFEQEEDAEITETVYYKGVKYDLGHFRGEPVVVFSTGISVGNAAMTTQMAIDYFPVDSLIMMGIAGGVNPVFEPGDLAVPERWFYHDESIYVNPDPENPGEHILPDYYESTLNYMNSRTGDPALPHYKNIGYIYPDEVTVIKEGWEKPQMVPYFSASPSLINIAKAVEESGVEIKMPSGRPIKMLVGGSGVTGSVFLDNAEYRNWLREVYNAEVTEMESAAVGHVCFVNDVDWVVIRSVSDLAGGQSGKNVENVFDGIASGTGAKFLQQMLIKLTEK